MQKAHPIFKDFGGGPLHCPSPLPLLLLSYLSVKLFEFDTFLEASDAGLADEAEVDLVAEELVDIVDAILNHGRALEGQAPRDARHVVVEAHRLEHLGAEHAAVADLDPLLEASVVAEDLHGGLRVGVVGGLEAELLDADAAEELLEHVHHVGEGEVAVDDEALDLVELAEVSLVHLLVTEDAVNGEVTAGLEVALASLGVDGAALRELVEDPRRDGGGVRSEDILLGLLDGEVAVVAGLVVGLDTVKVLLRGVGGRGGLGDEEGVLRVAGGVLLGDEEGIEVPEAALDPLLGVHLAEAELEEDLAELLADLEEGVEVAAQGLAALRVEVELLEGGRGPRAVGEHLASDVGGELLALQGEVGALNNLKGLNGLLHGELALLQRIHLGGGERLTVLERLKGLAGGVLHLSGGRLVAGDDNLTAVLADLDELVLHTILHTVGDDIGAEGSGELALLLGAAGEGGEEAELGGTGLNDAEGLLVELPLLNGLHRGDNVAVALEGLHGADDGLVGDAELGGEVNGGDLVHVLDLLEDGLGLHCCLFLSFFFGCLFVSLKTFTLVDVSC